jgi:pSer/pThr/pTyr-binding forkhead associated (FHA) protein
MEERTVIDTGIGAGPLGEATRVMDAPAAPPGMGYGDRTQQAIVTTCPVCSTPNPPTERFCQDCGLMFGSIAGDVEPPPDVSQLPRLVDAASGRELVLNPGANGVGREDADVLLNDPTVSRRHAQITLENGQVTVEDHGSTNGTSVSGRRLAAGERAAAYHGDSLKFGHVLLTLTLPGGEARPADAAVSAVPVVAAPVEDRGAPLARLSLADGTEYPLYEGVNTLGRRSANQIVLVDAFASGKHAEVRVQPDGTAELVDVGSTNGSFFNGERLAPNVPLPLEEGVTFTLGKTPLTFGLALPGTDAGAPEASEPVADAEPETAAEPAPGASVTEFVLPPAAGAGDPQP